MEYTEREFVQAIVKGACNGKTDHFIIVNEAHFIRLWNDKEIIHDDNRLVKATTNKPVWMAWTVDANV